MKRKYAYLIYVSGHVFKGKKFEATDEEIEAQYDSLYQIMGKIDKFKMLLEDGSRIILPVESIRNAIIRIVEVK